MADLSPRQREILDLVAAGRTSKEIASRLGISESTVNWHIANVFARLGASSRAEAVAMALREDAPDDPTTPPMRRARPPLPTSSVAIAVALTLVLGLLGGALMAGWNVTSPTSPPASAAPSNRAPQSAEPTARPTGVLAPTPESPTAPAAQPSTIGAPPQPTFAPLLPEIAPTSLPVASPLPDAPALPTLLPLPPVPRLPAVPMTGR